MKLYVIHTISIRRRTGIKHDLRDKGSKLADFLIDVIPTSSFYRIMRLATTPSLFTNDRSSESTRPRLNFRFSQSKKENSLFRDGIQRRTFAFPSHSHACCILWTDTHANTSKLSECSPVPQTFWCRKTKFASRCAAGCRTHSTRKEPTAGAPSAVYRCAQSRTKRRARTCSSVQGSAMRPLR